MNFAPLVIASFLHGLAIVARRVRTWPLLKKLCFPSGSNQRAYPPKNAHRAMVAGRSAHRPADQAHAPLGQAWYAAISTKGPASRFGIAVWCHLPCRRQGRWHRHASLHQRGHEYAPAGDILPCSTRRTCCSDTRSGRLAWVSCTDRTHQHHPHAPAAAMSRAQSR